MATIEIPDPDTIISLVGAFVLGLVALLIYYKVRPHVNWGSSGGRAPQNARLEEYERQLVDLKIRMDALVEGGDVSVISPSHGVIDAQGGGEPERRAGQKSGVFVPKSTGGGVSSTLRGRRPSYHNITDQVLHIVTDGAKTSRDIQASINKSREHTSRLLKKLYNDGLVERNADSKPYTYSITDLGRKRHEKASRAQTPA